MYDDQTCMQAADKFSCGAQTYLAFQESKMFTKFNDYMLNAPETCERYHNLADRALEHSLQKTVGSDKKMCIDKKPEYYEGPWIKQLTFIYPKDQMASKALPIPRFNESTKAKGPSYM
jgi:hypothetical protein